MTWRRGVRRDNTTVRWPCCGGGEASTLLVTSLWPLRPLLYLLLLSVHRLR